VGREKKNHVDFYENRFVGVNLDKQPSWAKVAQAMGAEGQTIEQAFDVGPALRAATKAQGEGKTTILEMMVTRELGDPSGATRSRCRRGISRSTSRRPQSFASDCRQRGDERAIRAVSEPRRQGVFVTGGGSGIGASVVEHFCEQARE
jgi:hypothetical protein